jgi:formate dehydrogenase maturation protein FdhE
MKNMVGVCPVCGQGLVVIVKETHTQHLYLCCDECETEWDNPSSIVEDNCLPFNTYGEYEYPTIEEIKEKEWSDYIIEQM